MANEFETNSKQKSLQKQLAAKTKAKLQQGVAFHQKGDLTRAKIIYEEMELAEIYEIQSIFKK